MDVQFLLPFSSPRGEGRERERETQFSPEITEERRESFRFAPVSQPPQIDSCLEIHSLSFSLQDANLSGACWYRSIQQIEFLSFSQRWKNRIISRIEIESLLIKFPRLSLSLSLSLCLNLFNIPRRGSKKIRRPRMVWELSIG